MSINSKLVSAKIIAESDISFGTSGARGLVTQFTANVCAAFTVAFTQCMKRNFSFQIVAIAIDNRPSSYAMAKACSAALQQLGIKTIYYGVVPTPALAYVAMQDSIPAIMVTGSHIPFDRNGLKFYRPDGEISKADEIEIITEEVTFSAVTDLPELISNDRAAEEYIERYTSLFDVTWLVGKRIGIYEHSSAGRDLYYRIFEKLGAEVIALERSDEFVPIDTEAVSEEDKAKAINWSKEYNLDSIFSTDGDGDRPLISDEKGNWLRGDILGLLAADKLNIEALAVPVSCNTAIESSQKFKYVARTKIGSPYVIAEFANLAKKFNSVAGFEANGGFLLGTDVLVNGQTLKALPTRDAVLPAIMLLGAARKGVISKLVNSLPQRFTHSDRIQNFATEKSQTIISKGKVAPAKLLELLGFEDVEIKSVVETDGLRITLADGIIVHLRPSGNAPELRCYAEADNYIQANNCVVNSLKNIQKI
ncbi:phosphomannomutase [Shewanella fidelis]|uniref:Phosphomannomutase n=1 Tax=Shewanella fidelis TaxID=173509 RepID=A0AAW8NNY3_9GAMM|nr:phosphomannomutase [Shewanella fidelis]MDR8524431.1 phosphomannomutase [Shewanella fidelis]MDW4811907.1 phosphomannomutase [Shewanella fidelis]MDW4817154.1 phosphomannomutase [Shewanella fidelis]MDW4821224.1 phosphomannomutase [Shewanella fidelis]MDW4822513.1 phosphomannomutase [Shewanella fidelis]